MQGDLLDGAVGIEEDSGDGVIGAGAEVEQGAGGAGDWGVGCWKTCFSSAICSRLLGVTMPLGRAGEWSRLRGWAVARDVRVQRVASAMANLEADGRRVARTGWALR